LRKKKASRVKPNLRELRGQARCGGSVASALRFYNGGAGARADNCYECRSTTISRLGNAPAQP